MERAERLAPREANKLIAAFKNHAVYCEESLVVADRMGQPQPMKQWPSQRKLDRAIKKQQQACEPVRILVLKTRRSGFTLGSCSHVYKEVAHYPGRRAIIIADRYDPAALEALGYIRMFNQNYTPIRWKPGRGTEHDESVARRSLREAGMTFYEEKQEVIEIYSAERGDIRGGGRQILLGDEVAFWANADVTLTSALNMVPPEVGTTVILQSTANGQGNEFYEMCMAALKGESGWLFVFFGWLEDENNYRAFETPQKRLLFMNTLDREEVELQQVHGASLEQLNWRRVKIATEFRGKVDAFHQEFPTTPMQAFLSTGRPALDLAAIARQPIVPGTNGELQFTDEYMNQRIVFAPKDAGDLTLWRRPLIGHTYIVGADPSHGRDVSSARRGREPDYSVAQIFDYDTGEQVGRYRARDRPGRFAEMVMMIAKYFRYAFLVPESNDPGFIDGLAGYPGARLYHMQSGLSGMSQEVGYYETEITRRQLVAHLDEALIRGEITLHDAVTQAEMNTFVYTPAGKAEHAANRHDDCVMATGLVVMGRLQMPIEIMRADPLAVKVETRPVNYLLGKKNDDEDEYRHYRRH